MKDEEPISNPRKFWIFCSEWLDFGLNYGNLSTIIVLLVPSLFSLLFCYEFWVGKNFYEKCGIHLELASAASTIEIASEQLTEVMAGCKEYPPASSQDFWQRNLDQEIKNLQQVNPTASVQEKNFTLSQFREVIKSIKEIIRNPGF